MQYLPSTNCFRQGAEIAILKPLPKRKQSLNELAAKNRAHYKVLLMECGNGTNYGTQERSSDTRI